MTFALYHMLLGVLFSGGKDSVFACYRAVEKNDVACLITLISERDDSYMFHTPNIRRSELVAEAIGIPNLTWPTSGREDEELLDLRAAISSAKDEHGIEGIVTGAIESIFQATRVQKICRDLDLWCFNPLWQMNQIDYLRLLLREGFVTMITGVFAYPLDESWVGAEITDERIRELQELERRYGINPSGEGGEIETFVLDGPIFKRRIEILKATVTYANYRGIFKIEDARLVEK